MLSRTLTFKTHFPFRVFTCVLSRLSFCLCRSLFSGSHHLQHLVPVRIIENSEVIRSSFSAGHSKNFSWENVNSGILSVCVVNNILLPEGESEKASWIQIAFVLFCFWLLLSFKVTTSNLVPTFFSQVTNPCQWEFPRFTDVVTPCRVYNCPDFCRFDLLQSPFPRFVSVLSIFLWR